MAKCLELIQSLILHSKRYMREHSKIFVCHFRNASESILSLRKAMGLKPHYQPLSISPDSQQSQFIKRPMPGLP